MAENLVEFGSSDSDGITFVRWSFWFNMPFTLFFIVREWPKYFGWFKRNPVDIAADRLATVGRKVGGAVGAVGGAVGHAAGSVLPSTQLTSALGEELTTGTRKSAARRQRAVTHAARRTLTLRTCLRTCARAD